MARLLLVASLVSACAESPPSDDITGPYTGAVHRFAVDSIGVPHNNIEARLLADDLNGDRRYDNQLGLAIASVYGLSNGAPAPQDQIAAGAIASFVEVQADDLYADATVAVRYLGADGDPSIVAGGELVDGVFASNRTRTTWVPGMAIVRLPVFIDADPAVVTLDAMQIDLTPDRAGGFDAHLCGGVEAVHAITEGARGFAQMMHTTPTDHLYALEMFDANRDGDPTLEEITANSLMKSLFKADLSVEVDGRTFPAISLCFGAHLTPCPSGSCVTAAPMLHCEDRVRDADEVDVDCGGSSCPACAGGSACTASTDCQTQSCDGTCAEPTCSDGVRDGYETDVDCGWNCAACAAGQLCKRNSDCASDNCAGGRCY